MAPPLVLLDVEAPVAIRIAAQVDGSELNDGFGNGLNKCPLRMPYRGTVCLRPDRQIDALSGILRQPFRKSPLTQLGIRKRGALSSTQPNFTNILTE
jgi:hypothetical protein